MTVYGGDAEAEGSPQAGVRPLTRGMRWLLLVASVLVFIIGIPLFLLSEQTDRYFAWTISPTDRGLPRSRLLVELLSRVRGLSRALVG
jgi:hypothetical protein